MMTIPVHDRSLEVRPITQEDLDAILEVYRQSEDFLALGAVSTASLEMVRADIEISRRHVGVFCGIYRAHGKMVGVLEYVPNNFEGERQTACLSLLMIAAPFRGQGIGEAVVQAIENEIRKDPQMRTIRSGVQVNNPQAIKFWQRLGYRIVSGPEWMPDQTIVFGLRKDL
jgi:ribosomal protein S18 acetylase RimI-like enzyme